MFKSMLRRAIFYICILSYFAIAGMANASVNAALVLNHNGQPLYEKNAHKQMYPASLTKLMTIYVILEAMRDGRLSFDTRFITSRNATNMPASKLWIKQGEHISVREALLSLLIKSCNDVAVVIAEGFAGTENNFVKLMNAKSTQLGMYNTHFKNASGLHHPNQVTTAHDMAKLIISLVRDFPRYNYLFSINSFLYKKSLYKNDNPVRRNLKGVDAIKTGYTNPAGWNIVTTARRGGTRLVGVILGGSTHSARDSTMLRLMDKYFALTSFRAKHTPDRSVKYR